KHAGYTGSTVARFILEDLDNQLKHFVKVYPKEYKKVRERESRKDGKSESSKDLLR
ncbi:MAG: hypothetical protein JNM88_18270, partial [Chitinophagaceae bacterium]|nr:hypothetical protein [Chitinophagaceae bacterium]